MPAPMKARHSDRLPPWRSGVGIVRAAAGALRGPRGVLVSEFAERERQFKAIGFGYSGPWRNDKTPYLVEPMDKAISRDASVVALMGPSQFGKTELILNIVGHAALHRPGDIGIVQPDREAAKDFMERRVKRTLLDTSAKVRKALAKGRSAATVTQLRFASGMMVNAFWPTVSNLSSRPIPTMIIDEYDRMPVSIGPDKDSKDGTVFGLAKARTKRYGKEGVTVVVGSPARGGHLGIEPIIWAGSNGRRAVRCLGCDGYFTPGFSPDRKPLLEFGKSGHLQFDDADADTARRTAVLVCPECGYAHTDREKGRLLARSAWMHKTQTIDESGEIVGDPYAGREWTWMLHGLVAPFDEWGEIASRLVTAQRDFEASGSDGDLRTVYNTLLGINYPDTGGVREIDATALRERAKGYSLKEIPAGVRFLVAGVDIQGDRFEVLVRGFGLDGESWLIDRFAIKETAGRAEIRPPEFPEHWEELIDRVFRARYPLADDPTRSLGVATVAIDTGGEDGVHDNAKAFWRTARACGIPEWSVTLVKGASNPEAPAWTGRPTLLDMVRGKPDPYGCKLFIVGGSRTKDVISNRLARTEPGPGAMHYPEDFSERHMLELTAERKVDGKWEKQRKANETLDCEVYCKAAYERLRPHKIDWRRPPAYTLPQTEAELAEDDAPRAASAVAPAPAPKAPERRTPLHPAVLQRKQGRKSGFVNGWR